MRTPTLFFVAALLATLPRSAHAGDEVPVRLKRRVMLGVELGWNSLAGLGVNASFHPLSHLSFDAGVGMSGEGVKTGLRARVNLLETSVTPFAAAGILYGFGTGDRELSIPGNPLSFKVGPSPFAQFVLGLDYTDEGGFTLLLTAGYALLLRSNVAVTSSAPDPTSLHTINLVTGGGLVAGLTLGYCF